MFKGLTYFMRFSFQCKKSYIICRALMEIIKIIIAMSEIVMPMYILNELFGKREIPYLILYTGIFLGINLIGGQINHLLKMYSDNARDIVKKEFELYLIKNQMLCDFEQIENPDFQELKAKADNYINGQYTQFGEVMEKAFLLSGNVITLMGVIYIIASIHILVVIVFLILTACNTAVNTYYKNKRIQLVSEFMPAIRRRGYFEDITKNPEFAKEICLGGLTEWLLDKYNYYMGVFCEKTIHIHKNDVVQKNVVAVTNFIQQFVTYAYLIFQTIKNGLLLGEFTMYLNAVGRFHGTLNSIIDTVLDISKYTAYYKEFEAYINFPMKMRQGTQDAEAVYKEAHSVIEFVHVSFRYPGQDKYVLRNINVKIETGEKISVVGENGAGKTTFIKLMTRLYDPTEGKILFNGVDIRSLNYDSYMKLFSVVFQDFKLFACSIKDNITLTDTQMVPEEKIAELLKTTGLYDKVRELKDGINTQISKQFDNGGTELSGGEGQKLAISRAIYKDTPFVVLDEPTSALDPRAECEIYNNFYTLTERKTAIFISHRLASSKICDKILVFQGGEVIQSGTHASLMSQDGLYKELFEMQAQFFTPTNQNSSNRNSGAN